MATTWSHRFARTERVTVGRGSVDTVDPQCGALDMQRVVVVTGRTLREQPPVVAGVEQLLGAGHVATFSGIREHVPASAVEELTALLRSTRADGVVSVGGGSPIDGAKAALYHYNGGATVQLAIPTTLS